MYAIVATLRYKSWKKISGWQENADALCEGIWGELLENKKFPRTIIFLGEKEPEENQVSTFFFGSGIKTPLDIFIMTDIPEEAEREMIFRQGEIRCNGLRGMCTSQTTF